MGGSENQPVARTIGEVIAAYCGGDAPAAVEFTTRALPEFLDKLKRCARFRGHDEDAREAAHHALSVAVTQIIDGTCTDPASITVPWLCTVAINYAIDDYRRQRSKATVRWCVDSKKYKQTRQGRYSEDWYDGEQSAALLSLAPPDERAVLELVMDGYTTADLAKHYSISLDAAAKRRQRAAKTIRERLEANPGMRKAILGPD